MRVLIVDDSAPRRHLLTTVLRAAGHETLTAANGAIALGMLETQPIDAVVSDVKMPRVDGFELCRAIRRDARLRPLPFIFYSSVFIGGAAHEFGMDLGATAYIDAKRVLPNKLAREIEQVVSRIVSAEYREALVRLHDDLEFARRYHAVILSVSDTSAERGGHDNLTSGVDELDHLLSRLDTERVTLANHQDVIVPIAELNRLRDLSDHLREAMNRPLGATPANDGPSALSDDAAASVRVTVRRINELVRKLGARKHVTTPAE
jgi:CheY-like chemotaxis protein